MDDRNEERAMKSNQARRRRKRAVHVLCVLAMAVSPAWAGDFEQTLPAEPGGELRVDLPAGHIEVESHDEATVELDGFAAGRFEFRVEQNGDRITVQGKQRGILPFFSGRVELHARVPRAFQLDLKTSGGRVEVQEVLGDVRAHTSGGTMDLEEIGGDVDIQTSGGRIQVKEVEGSVRAQSSGGPIHVSEVSGDVEVQTSGGVLRLREIGGEVRAKTSGGSIEARFSGIPKGELKTSGGTIEVEVGKEAEFDLEAKTSGGRVEVDDDLDFVGERKRRELRGRFGGGGPRLELETSGGNIRIRER